MDGKGLPLGSVMSKSRDACTYTWVGSTDKITELIQGWYVIGGVMWLLSDD